MSPGIPPAAECVPDVIDEPVVQGFAYTDADREVVLERQAMIILCNSVGRLSRVRVTRLSMAWVMNVRVE